MIIVVIIIVIIIIIIISLLWMFTSTITSTAITSNLTCLLPAVEEGRRLQQSLGGHHAVAAGDLHAPLHVLRGRPELHINICVYVCVYIYVCMYIYIYTYS